MQTFNRKRLIAAIAGLLLALAIHWINGSVSGLPFGLHETADDPSYLAPAKNFVLKGTWKDNTVGPSSYVQRPPLNGLVHAFCYAVAGEKGIVVFAFLAFALHGLALYALAGLFRKLTSEKAALILTLVYALLPCYWGFLSYQITEAISCSLVILTIASAFSERKNAIALTLLLFTACWLLRSVLLVLLPVIVLQIIQHIKTADRLSLRRSAVVACLCLLAVFSWEKRKASYMGSWGELHPIYHAANETMYRPVHSDLTELFKVWETKPEDFHTLIGSYWFTEKGIPDSSTFEAYYNSRNVTARKEHLKAILDSYALASQEARLTFGKGMAYETTSEQRLSIEIKKLADSTKALSNRNYQVFVPLKGMKEQLLKSQLNLEIFQEHLRGNLLIEAIRYLCLFVIVTSLGLSLLSFFSLRKEQLLFVSGIVVYLFVLFYMQRMNEDRYLLPLMPVTLICGGSFLYSIITRRKKNPEPIS